jgi:hypothetical protein
MKLEFLLAVGTLVVKYGISGAIQILAVWKTEGEPTLEDIRALKEMVPKPETYFEEE